MNLLSMATSLMSGGSEKEILKVVGEELLKNGIRSLLVGADENGEIQFKDFKENFFEIHEKLVFENNLNKHKIEKLATLVRELQAKNNSTSFKDFNHG